MRTGLNLREKLGIGGSTTARNPSRPSAQPRSTVGDLQRKAARIFTELLGASATGETIGIAERRIRELDAEAADHGKNGEDIQRKYIEPLRVRIAQLGGKDWFVTEEETINLHERYETLLIGE